MKPGFYPVDFFSVSDLDTVLSVFASLCTSQPGKNKALHPTFFSKAEQIENEHLPVHEAILILQSGAKLPAPECDDLLTTLESLRTPGWVVDVENLNRIKKMLASVKELIRFSETGTHIETISSVIRTVSFHEHLFINCYKVLDDDGNIRDDASPELYELRKNQVRLERDVEKKMLSIFKQLKTSGITGGDATLTVRNGRNVIPIPASSKYKIRGIIHDESATGQTVYIEPMEIVELGNKLRDSVSAQEREIRKILADISEKIRQNIDDVASYLEMIAWADFIFARAKYALQYNAVLPPVSDAPHISWNNVVNPVLNMHLKKQNKKVIPLTIRLNEYNRILVLSGANAGGKSVVLKTVALTQAMIQAALPVSVDENSTAGIFNTIFLDMGDGQSIEADLSTYSSHLHTMKELLSRAKEGMLFLIDEIGSGTDPVLGGAMAQAMLLYLHELNAMGVVTTHLDVLKKMADSTPGMQNASMIFDTEKLQPSFQMQTGIPGNSFTFEIANRTGIPQHIIDHAKILAGNERITFEQKISDVEQKASLLNEKIEQQKMAETFLNELIEKYSALIHSVEAKQKEIIDKTKNEARELLSEVNRTIENTVREIRESEANKEKTKILRGDLKQLEQKAESFEPAAKLPERVIRKVHRTKKIEDVPSVSQQLQAGMKVKHIVSGMEGNILEVLSDKKVKVAFNSVSMTLPSEMVTSIGKNKKQVQSVIVKNDLNRKTEHFRQQLDIRGARAEEVIYILEKHIDDALLIGIYDFSVLHGKGHGILRTVVRQILAKHPNVEGFESEHVERGGDGITLVKLKR